MTLISELKNRIDTIILMTRSDKIDWSRLNPTTFQWLKPGEGDNILAKTLDSTRVTLQKIESSIGGRSVVAGLAMTNYIFKITQVDSEINLVLIDTSEPLYESIKRRFKNTISGNTEHI